MTPDPRTPSTDPFEPYFAGYDRFSDAVVPDRERMTILLKSVSVAFERMCTQWRRTTGVSSTDRTALNALWSMGPSTMSELASNVGLSKAAATALVDRLGAMGYVERASDPEDRRRVIVRLLPAWSQQLSPLIARFDADAVEIAGRVPDEAWGHVVRLFDELTQCCSRHARELADADDIELGAMASEMRRDVDGG